MIEIDSVTRKWGHSSVVFVLPKEIVKKQRIKPNQHLKVLLPEQENVLEETFGMLKGKWKKSTQELLDEVDEEFGYG